MGMTRKCTRCTAGTETCVVGSFYTCDVCDRTENEVDEAFAESDEETTLDESFGGYFGAPSYPVLLSTPQPVQPAPQPVPRFKVGDFVTGSDPGAFDLVLCSSCGSLGAIQIGKQVCCPNLGCRKGGMHSVVLTDGRSFESQPNSLGARRWKRIA